MKTWFYYFYYRCLQNYNSTYRFNSKAANPLQSLIAVNLATVGVIITRIFAMPTWGGATMVERLFIGIMAWAGCFLISLTFVTITLGVTEKTIIRRCRKFHQESPEERARRGRITRGYYWGSYLLYVGCLLV